MTIQEIVKNKDTLIAQKKATIKHADGILFSGNPIIQVSKATNSKDGLQVKAVINTTNILDSHSDVHIKGLWKKSINENKNIMHLQEHQLAFDKIIADGKDLQATVKEYTWKELGYNFEGTTEALIFDSNIKSSRNAFMFKQYQEGNVKNHSVGMQYVKLALAVNDKDYPEEHQVWEKYIDQIANKQDAIDQGYFWAVTEAKVIEGSAVPIGSNFATPTLEVNEPLKSTQKHIEPSKDTQKKSILINILKTHYGI